MSGTAFPNPRILFGIRVHPCTMEETLDLCRDAIARSSPLNIGVVNVAKVVKLQSDVEIRESILGADLVLADGAPVVWASRLLRRPLPERVAGIDLFERLLEEGDKHGYSVYLLGATQEVLDAVRSRIGREHPGLRIAGSQHGYFSDDDMPLIVDAIVDARPDLLFVAITSPRKEIMLRKVAERGGAAVSHGVGGSFDVFAGKTQRAPVWMQRLGLEWLYRIYQEPRRMWRRYAVTNTLFIGLLGRNLIRPQRPFR